LVIEISPKS